VKISEADLEKIEKKMQEIIDADYKFICQELPKEEAIKLFKQKNEIYKLALLDDIQEEKVTIYIHNNFVDLCRGPHVESTGKVKYFKLLSISGAYW
ncbi:MAG: threonine--tRNA ligase, partial [Endomicrobia bacterium]|nr:threonine--tRNA ligase [Endomicrobiia bacterium]